MPSATVTVRELKNKETGVDLTVPTYSEVRGRISSTYEYHVVVVSNLPFFKSPKHKETDTVQFMVKKKFSDFEDLHHKLNEKFSGTVFPPLPRKVLIVSDVIAKERRSGLDHFVKFLTLTGKLTSSSHVLEFLGVNAIKAGKFRREVSSEPKKDEGEETAEKNESTEEVGSPASNLFEEEEEKEDAEFFGSGEDILQGDDIFDTSSGAKAKIFEDQEFGGGIKEDETGGLLFLPEAVVEVKKQTESASTEDNSDLLKIEDDIEKLLEIDIAKTRKSEEKSDVPTEKPNLSAKPKPAPRKKPVTSTQLSPEKPKPAPKPKPPVAEKPGASSKQKGDNSVANLGTDDIMQYIQANVETSDADLDLFS